MSQASQNRRSVQIRHRSLIYRSFVLLLLLILMGFWYRFHFLSVAPVTTSQNLVMADPATPPDVSIEMGAYIDNVYVFEAEKKTFDANGWLWLKWPKAIQNRLVANRAGIEKLINFANQTDSWDFSLEPDTNQPVQQSDGRFYQRFKFSGHFYADTLDLRKFPFQTIRIPLIFELQDTTSLIKDLAVGLTADRTDSGIGAYIDLSGYVNKGFELRTLTHDYSTRMGEERQIHPVTAIPQVRLDVIYQVSTATSILKLILPLMTVMSLALVAPSLSSNAWEVRLGVPPTALLTLIFLQQSYRDKLPELTYMTFMDAIYNVCYMVNIILFVLFLWSSNELEDVDDADRPALIKFIDKIDHRFQIGLVLFMIITILFDWYTILGDHG